MCILYITVSSILKNKNMKIVWGEYIIIRCMVWLWHTFSRLCTQMRWWWTRFTFFFIVHSRLCRIAFNKPRLSRNKNLQRLIAYTVIIRFLCQRRNDGVTNIEIYLPFIYMFKEFWTLRSHSMMGKKYGFVTKFSEHDFVHLSTFQISLAVINISHIF